MIMMLYDYTSICPALLYYSPGGRKYVNNQSKIKPRLPYQTKVGDGAAQMGGWVELG